MNELVLDKQQVAFQVQMSEAAIQGLGVGVARDYLTNHLVASITGFVLTDHILTEHSVVFADHPASWWQHTKAVHFPTLARWLRRPPRFTRERRVVMLETKAAFPQIRFAYPDELGPVRHLAAGHRRASVTRHTVHDLTVRGNVPTK